MKNHFFQRTIHKQSQFDNVIKPQNFFFYVGIVCTIILCVLVASLWIWDKNSNALEKYLIGSLIILFAILLGGFLIIYSINYKILLFKDYFIYQNFWRNKKKFYYKDIKIEKSKLYPTVQIKNSKGKWKNLIKLTPYLENFNIFMEYYKNSRD